VLISKIRTFKTAAILNNKVFNKTRAYRVDNTLNERIYVYTSDGKLMMAEAMAYNRQCLGMVGGALAGYEIPEEQKGYIKFYHDNFDYFRNIQNVADVAVLHSQASMAFNNDRPYQSTYLFEQTLIQEKIPFDIIFDDNLKDLKKYKVLVLADQECLSDEKLDLVRNFVNQGGGLVATGNTSLYTEWRQQKREYGLNDLFQINAYTGTRRGQPADSPVIQNESGKGRVVYIPDVKPSVTKPPSVAMTSQYWKLPLNWKELIASVKWASDNNLSLNVEAPQTVTAELIQKDDKSLLMLHLVNFEYKKGSVKNIKVDLQVPEGKKVVRVTVITPDGRNDEILPFRENGQSIDYTVPGLLIYNLIVMKLE